MYHHLDIDKIVSTILETHKRIKEAFPESSLLKVSGELCDIANNLEQRADSIVKPLSRVRIAVSFIIAVVIFGLVMAVCNFDPPKDGITLDQFIQVLEAGINDVVLIGAAIFFLVTYETRIRRERALKLIHELRSLAHVIDMHQLTKDPEGVLSGDRRASSLADPEMSLTDLNRYLDFCSEMLSLLGKIAALYVQDFNDAVVIGVVNEIENLTTNLTRKIWQKIMIVQKYL